MRKVKPFSILTKKAMTAWQWHQLDHMQIIRTSLQTDNHASTSSLATKPENKQKNKNQQSTTRSEILVHSTSEGKSQRLWSASGNS